jgi:hypothetical protein
MRHSCIQQAKHVLHFSDWSSLVLTFVIERNYKAPKLNLALNPLQYATKPDVDLPFLQTIGNQ